MDDDLTKILVAIARIEEQQKASREAADHRHNNAQMALKGIADKLETFATKDDHEELSDRVGEIEKVHRRVVTGALVGSGIGGGIMYAIGKKMGLVS